MNHQRNQRGNKKKYQETNDNENMMIQNIWYATKAVLRRKFIAKQSYPRKQEKISNKQLNLIPKTIRGRTQNT